MHFFRYFAGLLLLTACAVAPQGVATSPSTVEPFTVSSVESHYALRGAFSGTTRLIGDSLEVVVATGVVKAAGRPRPEAPRYGNVRLAVGIGAPSGASWEMRARSLERTVREGLGEGDSVRVDSMRFVIGGVHRAELEGRWLVFQLAALDAQYGEQFTTYACSGTAFFERPRADSERSARLRRTYESAC